MAFWNKEKPKHTALQKVNNGLNQVMGSKPVRTAVNALQSGMSSVDGTDDFSDLWEDQNGKFNAEILKDSLTKSLASSSYANQLYDKALDSKYAPVVNQLANAPKLNLKLHRKSNVGATLLSGLKDRASDRTFQAAKAQTLSDMSSAVNELARVRQQTNQKTKGYAAAARALDTLKMMKFGPKDYNAKDLMARADKEHYMVTGEHLSKEEKQFAMDALQKGYDRGYGKKGLGIVYARKKGGIAAQRLNAASDTVSRHAQQAGIREQMVGSALEQANAKMNQVMNMQGVNKRITGPRVNIDRFRDNFNLMQGATKKGAANGATLLTALSQTGFATRPIGITRVLVKRNLDEVGGADRYADALIHSQGNAAVTEDEIMSLKTALKKFYREKEFLDGITFKI